MDHDASPEAPHGTTRQIDAPDDFDPALGTLDPQS